MGIWRHLLFDLSHSFRGKMVPFDVVCHQYLDELFAEYQLKETQRTIDWSEEVLQFESERTWMDIGYSLCRFDIEIGDPMVGMPRGAIGLANLITLRAGPEVATHLASAIHRRVLGERVQEYAEVLGTYCQDVLAGDFSVRSQLPPWTRDDWDKLRGDAFPC
jgi:hypothetical protein